MEHYCAVNREWRHIVAKTVHSSLLIPGLRQDLGLQPTLQVSPQGQWEQAVRDCSTEMVLAAHFALVGTTLAVLAEYAVVPCSFPWRWAQLLSDRESEVTLCLDAAKAEWGKVLELEAVQSPLCKEMPHIRWQAYREMMTVAQEASWSKSPKLTALVKSYFPAMASSVPAEQVFNHLRDAETRGQRSTLASPANLQAVIIRCADQCYGEFSRIQLTESDWMEQLQKGAAAATVRHNVFDPSRITDESAWSLMLLNCVLCRWGSEACETSAGTWE